MSDNQKNYIHIGCGVQADDEKDDFQSIIETKDGGNLYLVDANPFIFSRIKQRYSNSKFNIGIFNCVIVPNNVNKNDTKIYIPIDAAKSDFSSTSSDFTEAHIQDKSFVEISCIGMTINDFLTKRGIKEIELLCLDCEGLDIDIIFNLDFNIWKPKQIIFEFMHSDGICKTGLKLKTICSMLSGLGYSIEQISTYNLSAVLETNVSK